MTSLGSIDRDGNSTVGFIGTGRAGTALGVALGAAGYRVVSGWSRSTQAVELFTQAVPSARSAPRPLEVLEAADIVFLTVPDSLVTVLAQALPWTKGKLAVHCSGALGLDVLAPAALEGADTGSFHPLVPLTTDGSSTLGEATIVVDGDADALPVLRRMAGRIGARTIVLSGEDRVLYHAAASILGNYTVTLFAAAAALFERLGIDGEEARQSLLPLLGGVHKNLQRAPAGEALTGPVARGDAATVERHLAVLAQRAPEFVELYETLARATVALASEQGTLNDEARNELSRVLAGYRETVV